MQGAEIIIATCIFLTIFLLYQQWYVLASLSEPATSGQRNCTVCHSTKHISCDPYAQPPAVVYMNHDLDADFIVSREYMGACGGGTAHTAPRSQVAEPGI
jgi:hypothetical protein